jgi:polyisoprenoid-binding protein YceI
MNKRLIIPTMAILLAGQVVLSCKNDKPLTSEKQEVTTSKDGDVLTVNLADSRIEWKGYKVFKSENTSHFGTIKFESGEVTVKDGKLESGKFIAEINSLQNVDIKDAEQKAKLEGHLKSGDFFEVEKFPTASFEITKVSHSETGDYNTVLDGNLTIKGITKPIAFKANVTVSDGQITIATEPTDIKREDFGVKFQIPVANGMIKDEVNIQILIKAKK